MNLNDMTNQLFKNNILNRELIILGDDGARLEIYSRKAETWPEENYAKGIYPKAAMLEKIANQEIEFIKTVNIMLKNSLK
jgi:phosphatidate phosphatase APP1